MYLELCDLCKTKPPNRKFKVKMSKQINNVKDIWSFYERVHICANCAEKLFGIKSNATMVKEIADSIRNNTKPIESTSARELVEIKQKQAKYFKEKGE